MHRYTWWKFTIPRRSCSPQVTHTIFAIHDTNIVIIAAVVLRFQHKPITSITKSGTPQVKIQLIVVTTVGWKLHNTIARIPTMTIMILITSVFSFSVASGLYNPPYRSYAKIVAGQRDVIANVDNSAPRKDAQISATTQCGSTSSIIIGVIIIALSPASL